MDRRKFWITGCAFCLAAAAQHPVSTPPPVASALAQNNAAVAQFVADVAAAANGVGSLTGSSQVASAVAAVTTAVGTWQSAPLPPNGLALAGALHSLRVTLATIPTASATSAAALIPVAIAGVDSAYMRVPQAPHYIAPQPATLPTVTFSAATIAHVAGNTPDQDFKAAWNGVATGVSGAPTL